MRYSTSLVTPRWAIIDDGVRIRALEEEEMTGVIAPFMPMGVADGVKLTGVSSHLDLVLGVDETKVLGVSQPFASFTGVSSHLLLLGVELTTLAG